MKRLLIIVSAFFLIVPVAYAQWNANYIELVKPKNGSIFIAGEVIHLMAGLPYSSSFINERDVNFMLRNAETGNEYICEYIRIDRPYIVCDWVSPKSYGWYDVIISYRIQGSLWNTEDYPSIFKLASMPRLSDVMIKPEEGYPEDEYVFHFILLDDDGDTNNVSLWSRRSEPDSQWEMREWQLLSGPYSVSEFITTFSDEAPGVINYALKTADQSGFFFETGDILHLTEPPLPKTTLLHQFQSREEVEAGETVEVGALWFNEESLGTAELYTNKYGAFDLEATIELEGSKAWSNFTIETEAGMNERIYWKIVETTGEGTVTPIMGFFVYEVVTEPPDNITNETGTPNQTSPLNEAGDETPEINETEETPQPEIRCGNNICEEGEDMDNCCADCGCEGRKVCMNNECLEYLIEGPRQDIYTQPPNDSDIIEEEPEKESTVTRNVTAEPNETVKLQIDEKDLSISEISIKPRNRLTNAQIEIKRIKASAMGAVELPRPNASIYQYLEIVPALLEDADIEVANIGFRVEKSWIKNNSVDPLSIKLYRFTEGWDEMETFYIGESNLFTYYESDIPGFSMFAIAGSVLEASGKECIPYDRKCDNNMLFECDIYGDRWELIEVCPEDCVDDECQAGGSVSEEQEGFGYAIGIVIIIVVLFIVSAIFAFRHRRSVDNLTGYGTYS